jgi:hypothetical protein
LATTLIEAAHQQIFFSNHLPGLTEVRMPEGSKEQLLAFLNTLVFRHLGIEK